jgi:hypothetical protein
VSWTLQDRGTESADDSVIVRRFSATFAAEFGGNNLSAK